MLAPKLCFLPSPCSLLEGWQQLPPFPSFPQLLLLGSSSPRQSVFPLQRPSPTLLQLLLPIPWPHRSSPVPISLSSYGDLHLCSPFCNIFPSSVLRCFCSLQGRCYTLLVQELLLPALYLPPCSCLCSLPLFYSRSSLSRDTSLQTRTRSYNGVVEI